MKGSTVLTLPLQVEPSALLFKMTLAFNKLARAIVIFLTTEQGVLRPVC